MRIVTMGVYGFDEHTFFEALLNADIDVFVDTRRRRAVRGARYAFANSQRLQGRLEDLGVPYVHRLDLAPSNETRRAQDRADVASGTRRRDRDTLTDIFRDAYYRECLDHLSSLRLIEELGSAENSILVFCVEENPAACHRSLLASKLASDLGAEIQHLMP